MDKQIHKEETFKELDELVKKWKREIRGLYEVPTDDKGKELIGNAIFAMYAMYDHLRGLIVDMDWDNIGLNLAVEDITRLKWEHQMLKQALKNNIALDELGQEIKKLVKENK